jgi:hypothetical protein
MPRQTGWKSGVLAPIASLVAAMLPLLTACTVSPGRFGEPLSLHAGEVVQVLTAQEIVSNDELRAALHGAGVGIPDIHDASIVVVRYLCCGPQSDASAQVLFNPKPLALVVGDVVETQWSAGTGAVNIVTRVLQRAGQADGSCDWQPRRERLAKRVMYCDWMPRENWIKQEGAYSGWYKAAPAP